MRERCSFRYRFIKHSSLLDTFRIFSPHPGKLFHIDFGYILGRDPKPLPPPMKLSKEMVEGMGGMQSEQYQEFRKQCYTAFLHLRRSETGHTNTQENRNHILWWKSHVSSLKLGVCIH